MERLDLLVVGGGNMGEALISGLVAGGRRGLGVVEPADERRSALRNRFGEALSVLAQPAEADGAVIAVKPQHVEGACGALSATGCRRVLSIAAGVTTASLESWLPGGTAVVRAMPNTPAQVGEGASAISPGSEASAADLDWAGEILGSVGVVVRVDEGMLDAVTGLSGSGPAYLFAITEALEAAGVSAGLPAEVAATLARQTVVGAGRLLAESSQSPAALREAVTSPGGTTAAGLAVLAQRDLQGLVESVVAAATARSKELGSA